MLFRNFQRLLMVVGMLVCTLMTACVTDAPVQHDAPVTATSSPGAFQSPISNQVEVHDESSHATTDETHHDDHTHTHLDPALANTEMEAALVPSEIVVGKNRFAVGLIGPNGQAINDAVVHFHYYDLSNPIAPVLESHGEAEPLRTPDGLTTIFAHEREFARAGEWGVEIQAQFPDGSGSIKRFGFQVLADSASPMPGEAAPSVETAVASDVGNDLSELTSAVTPNAAFYAQSLAAALINGKPTVLLFATPAFCQTRFCGPAYEITTELQAKYGERINFVHVEVYTGLPDPAASNWTLAPAMLEYGLTTEPWLFLIDQHGVVTYRVEGMFTTTEIERNLATYLGS